MSSSSTNQFVSTNNYNQRTDARLKINNKGKGPLIHLRCKPKHEDDLFLLESSDNKEMIKINSKGAVFIEGEKIKERSIEGQLEKQPQNEIILGSWKIVSDGDNLLIQKLVGNVWITKQHLS